MHLCWCAGKIAAAASHDKLDQEHGQRNRAGAEVNKEDSRQVPKLHGADDKGALSAAVRETRGSGWMHLVGPH